MWEELIIKTAKLQEDAVLIDFRKGREWSEEHSDTWTVQNDVPDEQRAYEESLPLTEIKELF